MKTKEDKKDVKGKLRMSLIPPEFLEMSANAFHHGAEKYGEENIGSYYNGVPETYEDAMLRHYLEYKKGNPIDEESGVHHLEKMFINAGIMALLELKRYNGENK